MRATLLPFHHTHPNSTPPRLDPPRQTPSTPPPPRRVPPLARPALLPTVITVCRPRFPSFLFGKRQAGVREEQRVPGHVRRVDVHPVYACVRWSVHYGDAIVAALRRGHLAVFTAGLVEWASQHSARFPSRERRSTGSLSRAPRANARRPRMRVRKGRARKRHSRIKRISRTARSY